MTATLASGDRLSRYRIVGPLGAGGMGEVYRAHDETLGRDVALKILPPRLVHDEDRLRRFVLEARAASSLNHPGIVTIHEIGADLVRRDGRTGEGDALHFIAMELIAGKTLDAWIHGGKADLKLLLGWLAQAAEGIAKAHAAGIIHRDLKPGNIMVTDDGFAKVLDFGLAKLIERLPPDPACLSGAPTEDAQRTGEGVVLGTVAYMSPEQVAGKAVDHRSDVFSFGGVLYEAATGRRPFVGDTSIETMALILKQSPASVESLNPGAPGEVGRLIRRCLAKDPNQRLDSMKTLAIELREIAAEYDHLPVSTPSGIGSSTVVSEGRPRSARAITLIAFGALILVAAGVWVGTRSRRGAPEAPSVRPPAAAARATAITTRGDVQDAVLSPDGRYLAYSSGGPRGSSLRIHQVSTGSDVEILPAQGAEPSNLSFSADGDRLYYLLAERGLPGTSTLFEIASMGGSPRVRGRQNGWGSIAPDGKRLCFVTTPPGKQDASLVVRDLDTGEERTIAAAEKPWRFTSAPAWSTDGGRIAIGELGTVSPKPSQGEDSESTVRTTIVDVKDGRRESHETGTWAIQSIAWLPGDEKLVFSAWDPGGVGTQLWQQPVAGGAARKITNDSDFYWGVSVSSDGTTLATTRQVSLQNLWMVDREPGHGPRQLTFASTADSAPRGCIATADGALVCLSGTSKEQTLSRIAPDGSERRPLAPAGDFLPFLASLPGGDLLFSRREERDKTYHVIRTDAGGGDARAITEGSGEGLLAASPGGEDILYAKMRELGNIWSLSMRGGTPKHLTDGYLFKGGAPSFSPDGRLVACTVRREVEGRQQRRWIVIPSGGGEAVAMLTPRSESSTDLEWHPDGRSLTFIDHVDGVGNVYRQPLDGGQPVAITRFSEGQILDHEWSPDGRTIVLARQIGPACEIVAAGADGGHPVRLARFESGRTRAMVWLQDGRSILLDYGTEASDAVLIRNFE